MGVQPPPPHTHAHPPTLPSTLQVGASVPRTSSPFFSAVAAGVGFDLVVAWADFENETSWVINVNGSDVSGVTTVALVQLTVVNVDEPVVWTVATFTTREDAATGVTIGTVGAVDPEGAAVTYSQQVGTAVCPPPSPWVHSTWDVVIHPFKSCLDVGVWLSGRSVCMTRLPVTGVLCGRVALRCERDLWSRVPPPSP